MARPRRGGGRGGLALQHGRQGSRVRPPASCPRSPPTRRSPVPSPSPCPLRAPGFASSGGRCAGWQHTLPVRRRLLPTDRHQPPGQLPGFFSFSLLTLFLVGFSGYLACCFAFVLLVSPHDGRAPGFLSTRADAGLGGSVLVSLRGEGTPASRRCVSVDMAGSRTRRLAGCLPFV